MTLRRVGLTTFAAGLLVATVLFVLGPVVAATQAYCPGPEPLSAYALQGVQLWPPRVTYTNGCNDFVVSGLLLVASAASLLGLAVAAGSQAAASLRAD
ncbi:hypothetical protein [Halobaculum sp. D14]|uniref:hypothetical protein n=1 Tax=Halobaculum sp. D14 TaxID=3421642 RepID=UPI003EC0972D